MRHNTDLRKSENVTTPNRIIIDNGKEYSLSHNFGIWIIYQLKRKDITQRDIARDVGVKYQFVSQVIYGLRTSARTQKAIALALGYESWGELMSRFVAHSAA